jgi:tripartite-type tricarboxylate transporter receptor subunit TctC
LLAAAMAPRFAFARAGCVPAGPIRPARSGSSCSSPAGGGRHDVYARFLAQRLQESLGQTFIVDEPPGAGSIIGTDAVAKSAPDGYTLLLMSNTHTVNESLIPTKPFQLMRDFAPIAPINSSDLVLVARSGLPCDTAPS